MKRTTCEYMMWSGLPVIRKEIAISMIDDYGLNQKETAKILGITPAAVCQYKSKKRGNTEVSDEIVLQEIKSSAKIIIDNRGKNVLPETCRICKILREKPHFELFCKACDE